MFCSHLTFNNDIATHENDLSISYKCVISMCENMTAFQMRRTPRDKIVQPPQLPKSNRFRRTPRDKIVQPHQAHNKRMTKMTLKLPRANAEKCSTNLPNKTYKQMADVPTRALADSTITLQTFSSIASLHPPPGGRRLCWWRWWWLW